MADQHVNARLDLPRNPRLPTVRSHSSGPHHGDLEPVTGEDLVHLLDDLPAPRVGGFVQHPAAHPALPRPQVNERRCLRAEPRLGHGLHLDDDINGPESREFSPTVSPFQRAPSATAPREHQTDAHTYAREKPGVQPAASSGLAASETRPVDPQRLLRPGPKQPSLRKKCWRMFAECWQTANFGGL